MKIKIKAAAPEQKPKPEPVIEFELTLSPLGSLQLRGNGYFLVNLVDRDGVELEGSIDQALSKSLANLRKELER
jgi:hypothetical protein